MNVLLVDSSVLIMERLGQIISEVDGILSVLNAVSYESAIQLLEAQNPGILLIDSLLQDNGCKKILTYIKTLGLKKTVFVLLNGEEKDVKDDFALLGANFVLDKYHEFEKIPTLINTILIKNR
jgi:DNA-binding NarL/FixJ family response regulator